MEPNPTVRDAGFRIPLSPPFSMYATEILDRDLSYTTIEYLPEGVFAGLSELTKL